MTEPIIRIAAKGEGVTASGRHIAGAVTGDVVSEDGTIEPGPHHACPPCRHFGRCGGCQLQHADDAVLADFVTDRVLTAARKQGIEPLAIEPAQMSPPFSRRRATLHAVNGGGRAQVGFREAGSHRLVDITECHVLHPDLFALVTPLRAMLSARGGKYAADIDLTLADGGVDCAIRNLQVEGLEQTEAMLDFARDNGLARLSLDQGYGPETSWEPEPVTITLSGVPVPLPPGAFLQATRDGERALLAAAQDWIGDAATVADLFAGLGTFAFALADKTKVLAVEAARDTHLACQSAARAYGRPVHSLHRDLFRNPLRAEELNRFDAALLDPPRAGAREQVDQIAESKLARVVYVSCNPASWARDAKRMVDAGFVCREVRPVGQFRWSTHVELASYFTRD
ncbi:23S rRNA (uracil(1939)-C(5))-methyltransferase [Alteripontixanthobacter maritimus]|uniref:23S rRNA (Uracil(1939)-C(5))-methyltransferase n=1 Tax=Alteripontixanthobacter maritimus TaxID=2161824 RepID=A0A369QAZ8_9SPHN|nr:class I SAM-dependent RNA methyltransferase [Alteripontixanthobacter maritimus]RDC60089.1 23S rRNA (uracil(1939)-C(5))-methyltransferase [Alteripontixanthobacter maritimus]